MDGFTVCGNYSQAMTFDCDLCGTHGRESVDHSESVASTRGHREDLQRCICHETGVWITELTFAVDQHRLRILTCVYSQTTGVSFSGIFMQPIGQKHDMRCQVKVIQVGIRVF